MSVKAPPADLNFVGAGDYEKVGRLYLGYFQELCDLQPHERVLDIGSGNGRIAAALTDYLTTGTYDGVEIVKRGVDWCRDNINCRYPRFRFHHADLYNRQYNREGTIQAAHYIFPFPDSSFDFIFLTSVFTHMLPDAVAHYLNEIRRMLAPSGRVFATFFILNETSEALVDAGAGALTLQHRHGAIRTERADILEAAVAYKETWVRDHYDAAGLKIRNVRYGSWSGRTGTPSRHDLVTAGRALSGGQNRTN